MLSSKDMIKKILWLFILSAWLLAGCREEHSEEPLRVAISKAKPEKYYGNYSKWLKHADSTIVCLDMYHTTLDSALMMLDQCSGLLISGGADVFPGLYGRAGDTIGCGAIDHKRDSLEIALIGIALEKGLPILGICRGEQILNVYFGGSLIIDIPSDFDTTVLHRCEDYRNCYHDVSVTEGSLLHNITRALSGSVTSNHHQAADLVAPELQVTAIAPDGLFEALEYKDRENKNFMLGVQWHPERMDPNNPLSGPVAKRFLEECHVYRIKNLCY